MERMTIIPSDQYISVDGEGYHGCVVDIDPHASYGDVHAIQWGGGHGWFEHSRGPAEAFKDIDVVLRFLPVWQKARSDHWRATHQRLAEELARIERQVEADRTALERSTKLRAEAKSKISKEAIATLDQNHRILEDYKKLSEARLPDARSKVEEARQFLENES